MEKTKEDEKMLDINLGTAEARSTKNNLVHIAVGNYIWSKNLTKNLLKTTTRTTTTTTTTKIVWENIVRQTELDETSWNIPLHQLAFKRTDLHFVSGS